MQVFFFLCIYLFLYIRWSWYFILVLFFFSYCFYIDYSLISNFFLFNSNFYDYIIYRISVYWSVPTYQWMFLLLGLSLFSVFYSSRRRFFISFSRISHLLFIFLFLFFYILWFFQDVIPHYTISYFEYNLILAHSLVSIHPPLLLLSIFIFRFIIFSAFHLNIFLFYMVRIPYLFLLSFYYFIVLGILLGSVWSVTLFGWGGWWIWDPIENISFYYLICLIYLLHSRRYFVFILIFFFYLDIILYYSFKFHFSNSLHVFSTQLFSLNINYWFYLGYLFFFLVICTFLYSFIFFYISFSFLLFFFNVTLFLLFFLLFFFLINFNYLDNTFFYYFYSFLLFLLVNYGFFVGVGGFYSNLYFIICFLAIISFHPLYVFLIFSFYWYFRLYIFFFLHHYFFLVFISYFNYSFINTFSYLTNALEYTGISFLFSSFLSLNYNQELSTLCWDVHQCYLSFSSFGFNFDTFPYIIAQEYSLNLNTREKNVLFVVFSHFFSILSKYVFTTFISYQIGFIFFILLLLFIYLILYVYYIIFYFFSFDGVYESIIR